MKLATGTTLFASKNAHMKQMDIFRTCTFCCVRKKHIFELIQMHAYYAQKNEIERI
jgi:hypothetical protein